MKRFYFNKRYFTDTKLKWVSFESSPDHKQTRQDIYGKCLPCLMSLYEQLKAGATEIDLKYPYNCWKVTVVTTSDEECIEILTEFETLFLGNRVIKGRFGSGDKDKDTRIMIFSAGSEQEKDRLLSELEVCLKNRGICGTTSFHRGCAGFYHELLGDWRTWKNIQPIIRPDMVDPTIEKIRKALYWIPK